KPIKYTISAPSTTATSVDVLVLDMFGCGGTLHVRDAARNLPPAFSKTNNAWSQHIVLRRGGPFEVRGYHGWAASSVTVQQPGEQAIQGQTVPGLSFVPFTIDLEDNASLEVSLNDGQGAQFAYWTATFTVQEITDVARSRFDALVQEHRTGK